MKKRTIHLLFFALCLLSFGSIMAQGEFITTWKTDNTGASNDNQITIPTGTGSFAYTVDWGDGTTDATVYTGSTTHTYASAGTYTVKISGDFPHLEFSYGQDNEKLLSVEQWGTQQWTSMRNSFSYCNNFVFNALDVPDLSLVTDMSSMFSQATTFNEDISSWDVSKATDMSGMFYNATNFNQDIGTWNVGNVITMVNMFANSAFNQDIGSWNVSNVIRMQGMFYYATTFNQPIGSWNVSSVTDMVNMFLGASNFNQDIGTWDVGSVTEMRSMFVYASSFDQNISNWDVSSVIRMDGMFYHASAFDQNIGSWNVGNVNNMTEMFTGASLSTSNYDSLLQGWSALSLQNGVTFDGGNSDYCSGAAARQKIIDDFAWTINDDGEDCSVPENSYFITTWKTDNTGASNDNQITIPT
ncbi:BspA family leucine-rich repeat surface protein, partial [Kriegella aquimaris]